MPRLLCIYQHAPTPGAPGFYRHRHYFSELVRRGWHVDLVSCPVDYLTGKTPRRYATRLYLAESIEGIHHHWTWGAGDIHDSRLKRIFNYASFATTASVRSLTLPTPDVIWASSPPLPIGSVGALTARRFRRPWLFEIRDLWPESAAAVGWLRADSHLYRLLERFAHRYAAQAASVLVPTPGLESAAYGHGARHVDVLPGIVFDRQEEPAVRERVRAELAVGDACLFAYIGALGVANGLDALMNAAKALRDDPRVAFLVAGDGSDRRRLEARVRDESIDNVRMIGPVPKQRVHELLAGCDVTLHLLRDEPVFRSSLPTKVLDGFSAHRPFITTIDGLPRKIAAESGGGYAGSIDELVAELGRWTAMTSEERAARGEEAFEYGRTRFGLGPSVDKLEAILSRVMGTQAS